MSRRSRATCGLAGIEGLEHAPREPGVNEHLPDLRRLRASPSHTLCLRVGLYDDTARAESRASNGSGCIPMRRIRDQIWGRRVTAALSEMSNSPSATPPETRVRGS